MGRSEVPIPWTTCTLRLAFQAMHVIDKKIMTVAALSSRLLVQSMCGSHSRPSSFPPVLQSLEKLTIMRIHWPQGKILRDLKRRLPEHSHACPSAPLPEAQMNLLAKNPSLASLTVALSVFCVDGYAQDECATATSIAKDVLMPVSTLGATPSGPPMSCGQSGSPVSGDIWLAYDALASEPQVVIAPDALLEVYEGDCSSLNSLGCAAPGFSPFSAIPSVSFNAVSGNRYYIRIADVQLPGSATTVIVQTPIQGDDCTNPLPIPTDGTPILASTVGATGSSEPSCFGERTEDVWFEFSSTVPDTAIIKLDVGGTIFTSIFIYTAEVYVGPCNSPTPLACIDAGFLIGEGSATINMTPGTSYYVRFFEHETTSSLVSVELAGSLAAELSRFAAVRTSSGNAHIGWLTSAEVDTAGFNIYRSPASTWRFNSLPDTAELVNTALIPAKGSGFSGAVYRWLDHGTLAAEQHIYWLEDIDINGASTMHGPFPVR